MILAGVNNEVLYGAQNLGQMSYDVLYLFEFSHL